MSARQSGIALGDAIERFLRLTCGTEPSRESKPLEILGAQFGDGLLLDEISPARLSEVQLMLDKEPVWSRQRIEQGPTLKTFFRFCYEMGFISRDLRPILDLDRPLWDSRLVSLPREINYISLEGKKRFEEELDYLYTDQRPRLAKWLADAAPDSGPGRPAFDIPKEIQSLLESRIADLESLLRNPVVIEESRDRFLFPECINVGDSVKIQVIEEAEIEEYTILGVHEADPSSGWISFRSPLGRALLGHLAGDEVGLHVPAGELSIHILEADRRPIVYGEPYEFTTYVVYKR